MILQKIVNWFKSKPKNVEQNSLKNEFTKTDKDIVTKTVMLKLKNDYQIIKIDNYYVLERNNKFVDLQHGSLILWPRESLYYDSCITKDIKHIKNVIKKFDMDILLD